MFKDYLGEPWRLNMYRCIFKKTQTIGLKTLKLHKNANKFFHMLFNTYHNLRL